MTQPREARWARRFTVWSLAITAACLPLYVVRWHYGPLPTTLLETLIGITVVGYLATLWTEKRLPAARTPYDIPIVLFLVAGVLGIVVAPDHIKAAGTYRAYFLEGAAIGMPHPIKGEEVKAFVVLKPGQTATADQLIAFCREQLAPFKVPKAIEFRDSLPKTLIGKVLRRQLADEDKKKRSTAA